jgi:hypothetical protein
MKDPSPIISLLPLVGVGEDGGWPPGIVRREIVFKLDAVTVWSATSDENDVAVSVVESTASDADIGAFADAARRVEIAAMPGVLPVTAVDPKGRWVVHGPVLGPLADFPALGWKLPRKLDLFSALCGLVQEQYAHDVVHGALTPWAVALDEAMQPVLVSRSGQAIWTTAEDFGYRAPELLLGALPTTRSDVYALGRILAFLLLASHPPQENNEVPRLDYLGGAPAGLTRIIRRATLADPALRYGSVAELLADVRNYGDFEKVGLELATAIELNKTGMSRPPKGAAAPASAAQIVREVPATYVAPTKPPRTRLLVGLGVGFLVLTMIGLGDPVFQVVARWGARRAFASAEPAAKGQALARMAALGERELGALPLAGADLSGCPLTGVSLRHADLSNAKLDDADMAEADLSGAILTAASAFGTNLSGANVTDAQGVETVVCDQATVPPSQWHCPNGRLVPNDSH